MEDEQYMGATIVTLSPTVSSGIEVASFEEAFGGYSNLFGKNKAAKVQKKAAKKAAKQGARQQKRMTRIGNRQERKVTRKTNRQDNKQQKVEAKATKKATKVAGKVQKKAIKVQGRLDKKANKQDARQNRKTNRVQGRVDRKALKQTDDVMPPDELLENDSMSEQVISGPEDTQYGDEQQESPVDESGYDQEGYSEEEAGDEGEYVGEESVDDEGAYDDEEYESGDDESSMDDESDYSGEQSEWEPDYEFAGEEAGSSFNDEIRERRPMKIHPAVKDIARKIVWNEELVSNLTGKMGQGGNDLELQGHIDNRLGRINELESMFDAYSNAKGGRGAKQAAKVEVKAAKQAAKAELKAAKAEKKAVKAEAKAAKKAAPARTISRPAPKPSPAPPTPVDQNLDAEISEEQIDVPAEETEGFSGADASGSKGKFQSRLKEVDWKTVGIAGGVVIATLGLLKITKVI